MKLLILTQKIDKNDDVLGFFHGWVAEFAKHCEKVTVIALGVGEYDLPENVHVLSLGKEQDNFQFSIFDFQIFKKLIYTVNFYKFIWQERHNYDNVFVHMNQIYVLMGWLLWKILGKKIGLWYAHGTVTPSLMLTEKLINYIFTSTESGFRINSKKKNVVGQGIDMNFLEKIKIEKENIFKIVSVGRFSVSKDIKTLILAAEILKNQNKNFKIQVLGGPLTEDDIAYFEEMKRLLKDKQLEDKIEFVGSVAYKNIPDYLNQSDISVNMGKTGSLDKVILEAMAIGLPTLTCNEAVLEVFGAYKRDLMYTKNDFKQLAERIDWLYNKQRQDRENIGKDLRRIVEKNHSLRNLITKILNIYGK